MFVQKTNLFLVCPIILVVFRTLLLKLLYHGFADSFNTVILKSMALLLRVITIKIQFP